LKIGFQQGSFTPLAEYLGMKNDISMGVSLVEAGETHDA